MDRHELLQKITTFPLIASGLAEDLLSGDFRSVFRGQGIEFDEVRHYELGDDIRAIDWNVSARFGIPYVKMYREERELTVCIVLDNSASMHTGGGVGDLSRYEQGVLAAALIAFSAESSGQRVGAVFFDRELNTVFSPRKGRAHIMAVISAALQGKSREKGSGLGAALRGTGRLLKRRSLVAVISDFLCLNWEEEMGDLSRRHDVIALRISSPLDLAIPDAGLIVMEDPETGLRLHAPAAFPSFRKAWTESHEERARYWKTACRRYGVVAAELSTAADAPVVLKRFFGGRSRRL